MSTGRHSSFHNSTEWNESVKYGTPLQDTSPLAAALNREGNTENDTDIEAGDVTLQRSLEEEDEEDGSDARTLLGQRNQSNNLLNYGAMQSKRVNLDSFRKKFRLGGRGRAQTPPPVPPRCECHPAPRRQSNKARNRLLLASALTLVFMIAELVGGSLSNSLAIMTDAAHMLSDFASFLISLFAIWIANRSPTKMMSFGWHRAEVLGAIVSVLLIWVLTGVLLYEAILRVIHQNYEIDANIMLITATAGVFVNVFMCMVLHQHDHGHDHSGHSHGSPTHMHGGSRWKALFWKKKAKERAEAQQDEVVATAGSAEEGLTEVRRPQRRREQKNINVQAAFIHVIGDLIQSVGVVIAAYIIRFRPDWHLADPICTFLFSILVLFSTLTVLRDALRVLMEASPRNVDYQQVLNDLQALKGVKRAHGLHIWSLTMDKVALSVHLVIDMPHGGQGQVSAEELPLHSQTGGNQDLLLDSEGGGGSGSGTIESAGVASEGVGNGDIVTACGGAVVACRDSPELTEDRPTSSGATVGSDFQEVLSLATQMLKDKYSIHQTTIQVESAQSREDDCDGCNTELPPPEWWLLCCNWGGHHHH